MRADWLNKAPCWINACSPLAKWQNSDKALMCNGFDAPPEELLKWFLKIDLNDLQLINDAVQILDHKGELLEKYYIGERGEA